MAGRAATGRQGRDAVATGRIQLGKGRIWPEEPAAAAMAEEVGRGRDGGGQTGPWDGDGLTVARTRTGADGDDDETTTAAAAAEEGGA